ncbi:MAG: hypothetical protein HMLKMBBP_03983 [Planctomycetes bacterium]|nr:hypothetical protein [Planctomycetota bacterium]
MRARLLLPAAALCASAAACKHAPIDGNADPRSVETSRAVHGGGKPGDVTKGELGPAAREAVKFLPHGAAGGGPQPGTGPGDLARDEVPVPDRWRIGMPAWERGSRSDSPWDLGHWADPYHQNVLKGDYPLPGTQNTFLVLEATSISLVEKRKNPTPSGVFTRSAGSEPFFGNFHSRTQAETVTLSADLFHGETSFRPVDWRVFVKGAFNWNYTEAEENFALFADPGKGDTRQDRHTALQQAFFETTLASLNAKYDVVQARIGTQLFNSDFRGFIFYDEALGYRLFGTADDNRWQWNAGYFRRWNKDTNSGLNTLRSIEQDVVILNLYRQDVLELLLPRWASEDWSHGLTSQISFHWFQDDPSVHYDENGFIVRPRPVGSVRPNESKSRYLGWANDGHIDRLNVSSALYRVYGEQEANEIAGREVDVDAWMAALELSVDMDWMRWRVQGFWQSGDDDPRDGQANGFDAIFDNPNFAGGEFGFWNRNAVRLTGSGVGLVHGGSLLNSLRSSKIEGSQSFVNPGLRLLGAGWDGQLTPTLKVVTNASHLWFDDRSSIEYVLGQGALGKEIGWDLSVGAIWRPGLTENVIVKGGVSALVPGDGFRDIYTADTLYTVFGEVILTW